MKSKLCKTVYAKTLIFNSPLKMSTLVYTPSAIQQPIPSSCSSTEWSGFKVVKDNFDQNIRPSFQRTNKQTISTNYCHVYAVKDRINLSSLSDTCPDINPIDILPTNDDLHW